jgi:putative oxidoreductase
VAIGAVFIGAGLQKLLGTWGGTGIRGATALFQAIHLAPAYPLAVFITVLELVGGSLLVVGAFTGWMAMPLVVEMIIAIWKVHFVHGFVLNWTLRPGVGHGFTPREVDMSCESYPILVGCRRTSSAKHAS